MATAGRRSGSLSSWNEDVGQKSLSSDSEISPSKVTFGSRRERQRKRWAVRRAPIAPPPPPPTPPHFTSIYCKAMPVVATTVTTTTADPSLPPLPPMGKQMDSFSSFFGCRGRNTSSPRDSFLEADAAFAASAEAFGLEAPKLASPFPKVSPRCEPDSICSAARCRTVTNDDSSTLILAPLVPSVPARRDLELYYEGHYPRANKEDDDLRLLLYEQNRHVGDVVPRRVIEPSSWKNNQDRSVVHEDDEDGNFSSTRRLDGVAVTPAVAMDEGSTNSNQDTDSKRAPGIEPSSWKKNHDRSSAAVYEKDPIVVYEDMVVHEDDEDGNFGSTRQTRRSSDGVAVTTTTAMATDEVSNNSSQDTDSKRAPSLSPSSQLISSGTTEETTGSESSEAPAALDHYRDVRSSSGDVAAMEWVRKRLESMEVDRNALLIGGRARNSWKKRIVPIMDVNHESHTKQTVQWNVAVSRSKSKLQAVE